MESDVQKLWDDLYNYASELPNQSHPDSPIGDETANRVTKLCGQKPVFEDGFTARTAEEIGTKYKSLRTDITEMSGGKAYTFIGPLAALEYSLQKFAINFLVKEKGFQFLLVPDILNVAIPEACGLMQRSEQGILYKLYDTDNLCLSGTGEMGVANFLAGKTFEFDQLPLKFVTISKCYRPETYGGRIQHGLYRVHEFSKVIWNFWNLRQNFLNWLFYIF